MHGIVFRKWVDRGWAFSFSASFLYVFSMPSRLTPVTLRVGAWLPVMIMPQLELAIQKKCCGKIKREIISFTLEPTNERVSEDVCRYPWPCKNAHTGNLYDNPFCEEKKLAY